MQDRYDLDECDIMGRRLAGLDNPVDKPASVKRKVVVKTEFVQSH